MPNLGVYLLDGFENDLVAVGWRVLRFTWKDVSERPTEVVNTIRCVHGP